MKRILLVLVVVVALFGVWSCSGTKETNALPVSPVVSAAAASTEDVEGVITQLERDWAAAIVKTDVAALDRLLANDFNGTSPTAHTFPKSTAIEDLKSGKYA